MQRSSIVPFILVTTAALAGCSRGSSPGNAGGTGTAGSSTNPPVVVSTPPPPPAKHGADPRHPEVPAKLVNIANETVPQFVRSLCPKASFIGFFQSQAMIYGLNTEEGRALLDYAKLRLRELDGTEAEQLGLERVQYAQWRQIYGS